MQADRAIAQRPASASIQAESLEILEKLISVQEHALTMLRGARPRNELDATVAERQVNVLDEA